MGKGIGNICRFPLFRQVLIRFKTAVKGFLRTNIRIVKFGNHRALILFIKERCHLVGKHIANQQRVSFFRQAFNARGFQPFVLRIV
ncbi:hypothetical protein Barb6_00899 [Bacteroidales bacterium Barb6]|nr:hypothetical protein Barb4_02175 [Bacteroidales bacterium Barb4]OAV72701.1 hypothetical protein Barb6_00899 [Bacteroidales bacterium Barb6]